MAASKSEGTFLILQSTFLFSMSKVHEGGSPVLLREEVELYMASLLLRPLYSQSGFHLDVLAQYGEGAFKERQVFFCWSSTTGIQSRIRSV